MQKPQTPKALHMMFTVHVVTILFGNSALPKSDSIILIMAGFDSAGTPNESSMALKARF